MSYDPTDVEWFALVDTVGRGKDINILIHLDMISFQSGET